MNEPFSEKSPRQVIKQSGQFSPLSQEDSQVSAQSVLFPQNRYPVSMPGSKTAFQEEDTMSRQAPADSAAKDCTPVGASESSTESSARSNAASVAYQAASPYPPVRVSGQNPRYAAAMLDNMAGQNSEMSAVGLYFYVHLLTCGHKDISDVFHHINIVEMHHLEIFAELAMQLGENPRLWSHHPRNNKYVYWSTSCLRYPHVQPPLPGCTIPKASVRMLLSQAIECEQAAIQKYMHQTTWIQDVSICDILRRISADEQMHVDIYTRLYHQL